MIRPQYINPFIYTLLIFGTIFLNASCCAKKKTAATSSLIKACPEEWIQNKMPGPESKEAKEYFIYEGNRRELKEFDLEWIQKNCNIKPQIVQ